MNVCLPAVHVRAWLGARPRDVKVTETAQVLFGRVTRRAEPIPLAARSGWQMGAVPKSVEFRRRGPSWDGAEGLGAQDVTHDCTR
jgi:hypothetical protein